MPSWSKTFLTNYTNFINTRTGQNNLPLPSSEIQQEKYVAVTSNLSCIELHEAIKLYLVGRIFCSSWLKDRLTDKSSVWTQVNHLTGRTTAGRRQITWAYGINGSKVVACLHDRLSRNRKPHLFLSASDLFTQPNGPSEQAEVPHISPLPSDLRWWSISFL